METRIGSDDELTLEKCPPELRDTAIRTAKLMAESPIIGVERGGSDKHPTIVFTTANGFKLFYGDKENELTGYRLKAYRDPRVQDKKPSE
jgi:hypothetical protein